MAHLNFPPIFKIAIDCTGLGTRHLKVIGERVKEQVLRFGVRARDGKSAATWRCWHNGTENSDFYLGCRALGGDFKTSFHQSGQWHISLTPKTVAEKFEHSPPESRFTRNWLRPEPDDLGIVRGTKIVVPWNSPSLVKVDEKVTWIPTASVGHAVEFLIFLVVQPDFQIVFEVRNSGLIGKLLLPNGETVVVLHREAPYVAPNSPAQPIRPRLLKGWKDAVAKTDGLRAIAVCDNGVGDHYILDVPAQVLAK